jgi:hypothetical protein
MSRISLISIAAIALLFGANALAQDKPTEFEVGLDYSLAHFIPSLPGSNSHNLSGGGGTLVYYTPIRWLGIKMDLQGYTGTTTNFVIPAGTPGLPLGGVLSAQGNLFTYMFGPVLKRRGKIEPYAQVLLGGAHSNLYANAIAASTAAHASSDNNATALTSGVGLDIHINRALSVRPVEVGYLLTRFSNPFSGGNKNQNSFRYSAGILFNFGGE